MPWQEYNKNFEELIMYFRNSPFSIQNKSISDLDNSSKDYPTLDDLIREQNNVDNKVNSVHRRRDLDSLG